MRKVAGLTGDQLAARLGWARSKVVKLENGRQMPTDADIRAWAEACGQPEAIRELLDLLSDAQAVHRQWRHQLRRGHAALQDEFDVFVRQGTRVRGFEVVYIPGLLQTPEYARYRILEAVRRHGTSETEVENAVAARMRRQEVLYDTSKTFEFVITEAAFRLLACPPRVLAAQLDRLLISSTLGNLTLGVIPGGVELQVVPVTGFLNVDDRTVVETFTSSETLRGQESAAYKQIFDDLMAEAVTGDEARQLITAAAASLRERS
jgi:transcriptional regulator with XRE-family HTH domain